ncbi:trypsin-like serine protease with C-terminal PDZ domain [Bernardetia litoralis DSM 6794]|uniref:Trypsin-like serine protease with C-terminal PDZ domain n=1 Tax=Bernardetia litoralis (strain ATCC 23117 / DSM 6794 / NBRC 15988 / NCIMB 1366 / Fx l1 / Sio-4) TaxID=880071 RepID=I4AJ80_BERLS|nr:PDZ domain-containing protein [Bernardetia litoralis]AFM04015.1 trypsin-like serine protease with C-terminal PDZ domain [Bernardetia litoralis DSM 6794]
MRFTICFVLFLIVHSFSCLAQSDSSSKTLKNRVLDRSAFVGAELGTLTNPVRVAYKMKAEKGIIIYKVFPNLAADKAGLKEKDVIIAVDSTHLNNLKEFQELIKSKNGNDTLNLFFVRNDTVRNTSLVLHFLPRERNFYFETMYDQLEINDSSQNNNQTSLRTILTFPRNNNVESNEITQFPLVIVLNSASNQSIERKLYTKNKNTKKQYQFYDWIENLTKNGFATLRIEKKGVGDSNGNLNKWTFEDEQKSISSALEKIKKQGSINQQKIYLIALGSSSLVALENFIQIRSDSTINFDRIFIEKLPSGLQKTKNQNSDSLLIYFPKLALFDASYSQNAIFNLKKYDLIMSNEKLFWLESKEDIFRVISRLKKEIE